MNQTRHVYNMRCIHGTLYDPESRKTVKVIDKGYGEGEVVLIKPHERDAEYHQLWELAIRNHNDPTTNPKDSPLGTRKQSTFDALCELATDGLPQDSEKFYKALEILSESKK